MREKKFNVNYRKTNKKNSSGLAYRSNKRERLLLLKSGKRVVTRYFRGFLVPAITLFLRLFNVRGRGGGVTSDVS